MVWHVRSRCDQQARRHQCRTQTWTGEQHLGQVDIPDGAKLLRLIFDVINPAPGTESQRHPGHAGDSKHCLENVLTVRCSACIVACRLRVTAVSDLCMSAGSWIPGALAEVAHQQAARRITLTPHRHGCVPRWSSRSSASSRSFLPASGGIVADGAKLTPTLQSKPPATSCTNEGYHQRKGVAA